MEIPHKVMKNWSLVLQLFPLMIITLASSNLRGIEVDRLSLLAFKSEVESDPQGVLSSWNDSLHLCEWTGVTCGRRRQRVTVLDLQSSQLKGIVSPHIGNLSFLRLLDLTNNSFVSSIPQEIGRLSRLEVISLGSNFFEGKVTSLARAFNLVRLEMGDNNLKNEDGDLEFLSSLVNCTSLELLDISGNNFEGLLPESISNLSTTLKMMNLGRNQLRGSIPIGIGNLPNLGVLSFEKNKLKGTIPNSVCQITYLYNLFLSDNHLSGPIPSCLGNLTLLSRLVLKSNNLQGGIPESLGRSHNLLSLVLSRNNLWGPIPQEVLRLQSLSLVLDLSSNQFSGYIPMEVGFLPNLAFLNLAENKLSGEILQSLWGSTSLERLHLSGNMFKGTIPQSLSSLRGLQDLDLSCNNFTGPIPDYLQTFPFLQNLNLSFNDFSGEVPMQGVFRNTSAVSLKGNNHICGGAPQFRLHRCIPKPANALLCKLVVSFFASGAIGVIWVLYVMVLYRSGESGVRSFSEPPLDVSFLKLSYHDLLKATDGFSSQNLIGSGSSGSVYWGVLDQHVEKIVAVKVLNLQSSRASINFISECEVLKNIRHRNIVKLVTACSSIDHQGNEFKALVFEFMLDGNLDEWLHYAPQRRVGRPIIQLHLNLVQRVNIAIDIASALDYLHNRFHIPIVHCDLKPGNVLLENDMTACVCDFGLATYLPDNNGLAPSVQNLSNSIRGTIGYIAPEYGMGSAVSKHGDVYSYGILLLEMLTGKRPTDNMFRDDKNLHNFVLKALPERVKDICDPVLLQVNECSTSTNPTSTRNAIQNETQRVEECLNSIARLGVVCSASMPKARKEMGEVVAELCVIRDALTGTGKSIYNHRPRP